MNNPVRTRFAPSPSGRLHLGHALAARIAVDEAAQAGGVCYLRIEDIDMGRCRAEFVQGIMEDMDWLGLSFEPEVIIQSERFSLYSNALDQLREMGVLYPCFCSRKQVMEEIQRMDNAPQGEELERYPGTCRGMCHEEKQARLAAGEPHSWRLDCRAAARLTGPLAWRDRRHGEFICQPETLGDVILARKDCPCSYHVAVVVDDAAQGITLVTRGEDLLLATHVHRLLQELLSLPVPEWYHHSLIKDAEGKRLAKRDKSTSLEELRQAGWTREKVWELLDDFLEQDR